MTRPRSQLISLDSTPYYHCISRCVRRAFLCGTDSYSGKDYSHRRQWMVDRLRLLASVFAVEVYSYAIMSNHYHLVLRVRKDMADNWTNDEVLEQWFLLFKPDVHLINQYRMGRARHRSLIWTL